MLRERRTLQEIVDWGLYQGFYSYCVKCEGFFSTAKELLSHLLKAHKVGEIREAGGHACW